MSRYVTSFFIASFLYAAVISSLLYSSLVDINRTKKPPKAKVVKIHVIKQSKPVIKPKPIIKPKPKPKPIIKPKPKPKPIIKPKPKPKPIIKPKPKPKPIIKPKPKPVIRPKPIVKPKPIIEQDRIEPIKTIEVPEKIIEVTQEVKEEIKEEKKESRVDIEFLKKAYFDRVRSEINKHKIYPKRARRRGMQGDVKVCFLISKDGKFLYIKEIKGRKILKKSAIKAIKRSFPLKPENFLFKTDYEITVTIVYRLVR